MAIRISYTKYQFTPPEEPLEEAAYEAWRQIGPAEFKVQVKESKKAATPPIWQEFWRAVKYPLAVAVGGILLYSCLEPWGKIQIVNILAGGLFVIGGLALVVALYMSASFFLTIPLSGGIWRRSACTCGNSGTW